MLRKCEANFDIERRLVKYVGSKARVAKHIAPIIQRHIKDGSHYVEPFVGGANLITNISAPSRSGFDANQYVVALLVALRDGWVPPRIQKEQYTLIKSNMDSFDPELVGWAGVGCSYSGKWFDGYAGVTATKNGTRDYIAESIRNCLSQAPLLDGISFGWSDYTDLDVPDGSVVYCDPPYAVGRRYYGEQFDSDQFWKWCSAMSDGCTVLVSEYTAPEGWRPLWHGNRGSSLSANGNQGWHTVAVEKLFIYEPNLTIHGG